MTKELTLIVIDHDGTRHEVPALAGWRVMEIIRDHDLNIRAECGGSATCATCHVYVGAEWADKVGAPNSDELHMLDTAAGVDRKQSRLSCQIIMRDDLDGMIVTLAPGSEIQ